MDEHYFERNEAAGTNEFVKKMNDLFDLMNCYKSGILGFHSAVSKRLLQYRLTILEQYKAYISP